MRRGWREHGDSSRKDTGTSAFSSNQTSPAEFSQTLPRQFRPQTPVNVVANRPPRLAPLNVAPRAQQSKAKGSFGWREARVGCSIQKSNSLTNIGNASQFPTSEKQASEAQEEASRPLARTREVVSSKGRNHAGIRRSASLRSLLANTDFAPVPAHQSSGPVRVSPPSLPRHPQNQDLTQHALSPSWSSRMTQSLHANFTPSVDSGRGSSCNSSFSMDSVDDDLVSTWLRQIGFDEYYGLFMRAGYDLATISR